MTIPFTKMHGLGNDFIVLDQRESTVTDLGQFARTYCDRRFGIGADQLLTLTKSKTADFRMLIHNADGSEVEMCGNGIRCLAAYIWDRDLSDKQVLEIQTLAGTIRPERAGALVKVDMGAPRLEGRDIPVAIDGRVLKHPLEIEGTEFQITCVSMGNPHAVIFTDNVSEFPVSRIGPAIETHSLFPNRTNVEFVQVLSAEEIKIRVWERGAGETLACGTGACASLVAASLNDYTGNKATVHLKGGNLHIDWANDGRVYMTGPAVEVFQGEITP